MEKRPTVIHRLGRILLSPWSTAAAITLGVALGLWLPTVSIKLKPIGEIYLSLLQMCSLPLVICGVVSSIGRMLSDQNSKRYILRLVCVIIGGLFLTAALALVLGLYFQPGSGLSSDASKTLGRLLSNSELSNSVNISKQNISVLDLIINSIPKNIFTALSSGSQMPILVFSIFLGISLGVLGSIKSEQALHSFEATFDALLKLIDWMLYALPIGLLALLAPQIAEAGIGIFSAMIKLILLINLAVLISLIAGTFVIAQRSGKNYFVVLKELLECLIVAFATKSSFAAIPSAIRGVHRLGMDKQTTDLVVPLCANLNPVGNVHYYMLSAIFIAQLYGVSISFSALPILILCGIMAAIAGSALPTAAAVGVIAMLLEPLGLPVGSSIILILAIDPFIDPAVTALNIHGSCMTASVVCDRVTQKDNNINVEGKALSA
ncbi:MAG: dicarboxylate/amino acid:cation symporter [Opitutaceae bacterium]